MTSPALHHEATDREANPPEPVSGSSVKACLGPDEEVDLPELLESFRRGDSPVLVDVRSPTEFREDHIPGSRSVPLFTDAERAVVGTLFRHAGFGRASQWGSERVHERLQDFTRELESALELPGDDRLRVVCCARGGLRSASVSRHLRGLGYPVLRLRGGYRAYRSFVRSSLDALGLPRPVVVNGLTGSGKTRILRHIARRHPARVVDLEGLAGHRSSVLGDIGLSPASQKRFESGLVRALADLEGPWSLFEWEARRIGDRELPLALYRALREAPHLEIRAPVELRVDILCEEYLTVPDGTAEIGRRLPSLERFLGTERVAHLIMLLRAGRVREVARELLEHHYDPRYRHGHSDIAVAEVFEVDTLEETADRVVAWIEANA